MHAFFKTSNDNKSAGDYINRKRSENNYSVAKSNKNKNHNYIKSYDELLNLKLGKQMAALNGKSIEVDTQYFDPSYVEPDIFSAKINNCGFVLIGNENEAKKYPISQTWNIYEGSFLAPNNSNIVNLYNLNNCDDITNPSIAKTANIYAATDKNKNFYARLDNKTPLRGFTINKKLCFPLFETLPYTISVSVPEYIFTPPAFPVLFSFQSSRDIIIQELGATTLSDLSGLYFRDSGSNYAIKYRIYDVLEQNSQLYFKVTPTPLPKVFGPLLGPYTIKFSRS